MTFEVLRRTRFRPNMLLTAEHLNAEAARLAEVGKKYGQWRTQLLFVR